jgi:hypothetical protein
LIPTLTSTNSEALSGAIARRLAMKLSRRSFIGRIGKGTVALSLGGAGAALILPEAAWAHSCPGGCDCSHSVTCGALTGSNSCPSGTCECGCWTVTDCGTCSNSPGCLKYWCDCCGGDYCHGGAQCRCVGGSPSCCIHKTWSGGCGDSSWHIACRKSICA